ncbi:competence/damage-inducible protein A [Derxia gummosa]|uniref:Competence/damage-inducible protein A n=1 Tax=Derxia gummosa DSM 723 TaxID=1121388 RepID=A0A8B6X5V0_9BURK|nr:molybdopterin-binding protein [Derxia gummosa]
MFGLIIIGDEILSGKREDKHLSKVIQLLGERGLALSWAHYLPDDRRQIADFLRRSFNGNDIVFCTGGIGGTPDDHTRQAAAIAAEVALHRHPEAARLILERAAEIARERGDTGPVDPASPENAHRLTMADLPHGCDLVPNPYNRIPGFSIGQHYFVPGFPVMAWPMIQWVLDTKYAHLFQHGARGERSAILFDLFEAQITGLLERIEAEHVDVKIFSLPSVGTETLGRHIEVGVKGPEVRLDAAFDALIRGLKALGGRIGTRD